MKPYRTYSKPVEYFIDELCGEDEFRLVINDSGVHHIFDPEDIDFVGSELLSRPVKCYELIRSQYGLETTLWLSI